MLRKLKNVLIVTDKPNKSKSVKVKIVLIEGKSVIGNTNVLDDDNSVHQDTAETIYNEDDKNIEEDEIDDDALLLETFIEILPSIIALLAMFSNQHNYNCDTIDGCITNCKNNINLAYDVLCNCGNYSNSDIFSCYMNPSYSKTKYTKSTAYTNFRHNFRYIYR